MKTVYAPDTAHAYMDSIRELAVANPVIAFAACVALTAVFATWASKNLF